jgi:putative aminopeptidase FrvX
MSNGRRPFDRDLLQELVTTYAPGGQEVAVRDICQRELAPVVDDLWIDRAGNLVAHIFGRNRADTGGDKSATRIMAHLDELAMMVKRIEDDGSLHLTPLGTMYPGNFGLGPVAILGDRETLVGVLTVGSEHTTKESARIWETKPDQGDKSLDWLHVYVFTGRTPDELAAAGVGPGTRVCVHESKRMIVDVGPGYVGSYFLDDRAAVAALLLAAKDLKERGERPRHDAYLVFTTHEEIGGVGGSYASRNLPGDLTVALEVGPTEAEYGTAVAGGPIVGYSDALCIYDKDVADRLMAIARELDSSPQAAALGAFESDASHAKANGLSPRAGLLCLPTLSTHGYEVVRHDAISEMADIVSTYLRHPDAL